MRLNNRAVFIEHRADDFGRLAHSGVRPNDHQARFQLEEQPNRCQTGMDVDGNTPHLGHPGDGRQQGPVARVENVHVKFAEALMRIYLKP